MTKRRLPAVLALACALAAPASAQSVHALDGSHESLSNNYQGRVLFINYTNGGGGAQFATAVRINDYYALTAAHVAAVIKAGTQPLVGTGTDALTDQGVTRNIVAWGTHPTWNGVFNGAAVDLAWLRFDSPLPGPPGHETETIKLASLQMPLTMVGFGQPATPATGLLPVDHQRRAFETVVDQNGDLALGLSNDYSECDFRTLAQRNLPQAGVVTSGNSGSPGFSDDGFLRTISNAVLGGTGYGSSTIALRLYFYRDWIAQVTAPPCPPDLNTDGVVDNGDISAFIALFLAGDPSADFNGDTLLDNGDIGAFINAFLAGCPDPG